MSTAIYVIGFIVLIAGLAWAATVLGVPSIWITIGVVVVAGVGILGIAGYMRDTEARTPPPAPRDPPPPSEPRQPPPA